MFFINMLIILMFALMALISRKHYSKYKNSRISFPMKIFKSVGEMLYDYIKRYINHDKLGRSLRKLKVISGCSMDGVIRAYVVNIIAYFIGICVTFNLLSFGVCCFISFAGQKSQNFIERESYEGDTKVQEIYLNDDGKEDIYMLEIGPLEYEWEQFEKEAQRQFMELETIILGENTAASDICYDLYFPTSVGECFSVEWESQNPELLSSSGKVYNDDLIEDTEVFVQAGINYHDMSLEHTYSFIIKGEVEAKGTKLDLVGEGLSSMERDTRNNKSFILPDEILGTKISIKNSNSDMPIKILILGMVFAILYAVYQRNAIVSKGKERDDMLLNIYPHFVNRLWLLIGAGMTIKSGLRQIVQESDSENLLIMELEYTLNQIEAGEEESKCYEQLGTRLGLMVYNDLFSQLSQNLVIGSRDILRLMEDEVTKSMEIRKETIRKKGEKASTKLLFPMALMLAVVLIIMIVPAFYDLGGF